MQSGRLLLLFTSPVDIHCKPNDLKLLHCTMLFLNTHTTTPTHLGYSP